MAAKQKRPGPLPPQLLTRIKNLRRLSRVVASGNIGDTDQCAVILALDSFADLLHDPAKLGRPPTAMLRDHRFVQLAYLYELAQPPAQQAKKSPAWWAKKLATLTGWKVPRGRAGLTRMRGRYIAAVDRMDPVELAEHMANMVELVPADKREAVAFAIGLRKK
ncbi:MAG: hypothetical protein WDO72_19910 [Pseudomonadota bacterium]